MINIGICDDNKNDIKFIADKITKALFDEEELQFFKYTSGEQLLQEIKNDRFNCNLLYLDIFMKPVDGMDVAEYIREKRVDVDIIFITNSKEHVYRGYTYKAFAYILKENMETDIENETKRYYREICESEECLNITSDNVARRVPISQILYVESSGRKLTLHMKTEDVSFYAKMIDIEPILTERGFIRTHQSYMVRIKCISGITRETIDLGEISVPISRRYYNQVKEIFNKSSIERGDK